MATKRPNTLSLCALILAAAAFFNSLWPSAPAAHSAPAQQDAVLGQGQVVSTAGVTAAEPLVFSYQGILRDPNGALENGDFPMRFRLYDAVSGGTQLYEETQSAVVVRDGIFNVLLGQGNPISANTITTSPLFLGIAIGNDAEMQPRQQIHAVPLALSASTLSPGASIAGNLSVQGTLNAGSSLLVGPGGNQLEIHPLGDNSTEIHSLNHDLHVNAVDHTLLLNTGVQSGPIHMGNGSNYLLLNGKLLLGPAEEASLPIFIRRFENLPNDADWATGINAAEYHCVAAGWSAQYDINEVGTGVNRVWTHVVGSQWSVHVSLNSHNDDASPDVDIVCFNTKIANWAGPDNRDLDHPD